LIELAENGEPRAVELLAQLACEFTEVVNKIAREKPGLVAPVARFRTNWPRMVSNRDALADPPPDFDAIQMGHGLGVSLGSTSKYTIRDKLGATAWGLYQHVDLLRRNCIRWALKENGLACGKCRASMELDQKHPESGNGATCGGCYFRLLPGEMGTSAKNPPLCELCRIRDEKNTLKVKLSVTNQPHPVRKPLIERQNVILRLERRRQEQCELCSMRLLGEADRNVRRQTLDIQRRAAFLPSFWWETVDEWWEVAKCCLAEGYKDEKGKVRDYVPSLDDLPISKSKEGNPPPPHSIATITKIRHDVRQSFKEKFDDFAKLFDPSKSKRKKPAPKKKKQ
jgi:DNA-binding transcriptional MerR regulator